MNPPHGDQKQKTGGKVKLVALGCRTNQYELQAYRDQLLQLGYTSVEGEEEADICIINTCTVTENAERDSRYEVKQLIKRHPNARIAVTGCAAERNPTLFSSIPGVSDVISNSNKEQLLPLLYPEKEWPEFSIRNFNAHTRAFLKIQDGCNSYCSYCIIPYVRGRSRSRTVEEIVQEAKELISNGYREIVLTGINIGDFDGGIEPPMRLVELVKIIDSLDGLERLRISSIDPDEVDDDLADALLNGKHTCKSMHLVLQSGSNVILKRMNRKYTRQIFLNSAKKMVSACPQFTFTTDVIVGFPGETEEDHKETLEVMKQIRFAKVHMFPFSPRERTRAAIMPNQIPKELIAKRKAELLQVAENIAFHLREESVGTIAEILTEGFDPEKKANSGHTDNFLPVWIEGSPLKSNLLVSVQLTTNRADGLVGIPLASR